MRSVQSLVARVAALVAPPAPPGPLVRLYLPWNGHRGPALPPVPQRIGACEPHFENEDGSCSFRGCAARHFDLQTLLEAIDIVGEPGGDAPR